MKLTGEKKMNVSSRISPNPKCTVYRQVQDAASSTIIRFGVTKAGRQRYQCTRWRERWRA